MAKPPFYDTGDLYLALRLTGDAKRGRLAAEIVSVRIGDAAFSPRELEAYFILGVESVPNAWCVAKGLTSHPKLTDPKYVFRSFGLDEKGKPSDADVKKKVMDADRAIKGKEKYWARGPKQSVADVPMLRWNKFLSMLRHRVEDRAAVKADFEPPPLPVAPIFKKKFPGKKNG